MSQRTIVVTGAASGIGAAITQSLLDANHSVAAIDINSRSLEQLAQTFGHRATAKSPRLFTILADLERETECLTAIDQAAQRFGRIDGLINNVGIGVSLIRPDAEKNHPSSEEISCEVWDRFFAINVRAAFVLTKATLPFMKGNNWGRVINNTTSYRTMLRVLPYGATKAALESMSAIWAAETVGSGITVNVLVPGGPTDTKLIANESGWPREEMLSPKIMGAPVCWLMSDEANDITGLRITARDWQTSLSGREALRRASRRIGWPELADPPAPWQQ